MVSIALVNTCTCIEIFKFFLTGQTDQSQWGIVSLVVINEEKQGFSMFFLHFIHSAAGLIMRYKSSHFIG